MSDIREDVLVSIKLDQDEGQFKKLADLKGTIIGLKTEQKGLESALKSGAITQKEYNSEIVRVEALQKKANAQYSETQRSVTGLKNPLTGINEKLQAQSSALDTLVPGLGSAINGFNGMISSAKSFLITLGPVALIIGAIGLAIGALTSYFKGSEEGQNKWNTVLSVGGVLLERLKDIAEDAGEILVGLFAHPLDSLKAFGLFLGEQIINRFVGMLELIPNLGKAVGLLFEGNFAQAGEVAADAVAKVVLGVEGATGKVISFAKNVSDTVDIAIKAGTKLAEMQAQIDKDERLLIVERQKTNLEVLKQRTNAIKLEGKAKYDAIQEAVKLEEDLADKEVELAKLRADLSAEKLIQNGDDKDALNELAEANAAVLEAEANRFANTLKLNKELETLRDEIAIAEKKRMDVEMTTLLKKFDDEEKAIKDFLGEKIAFEEDAAEQVDAIVYASFRKRMDLIQQEILAFFDKHEKEIMAAQATMDVTADISDKITAIKNLQAKNQLDSLAIAQHAEEEILSESQDKRLADFESHRKGEENALQYQLDSGLISQDEYNAKKRVLDLQMKIDKEKLDSDIKDESVALQKKQKEEEDVIKKKAFEGNKKNQIIQTGIDAVQSAVAAFRALAGIPIVGPVLAVAAGAAALLFGKSKIQEIEKSQYVPGFFEGGFTGGSNPRRVTTSLGNRDYTYHELEYITPTRILNTEMGSYHVGQLEAMRTGKKSFADGGFSGSSSLEQKMDVMIGAIQKMDSIKYVMPVEDLDIVQERRVQVAEKATM